MLSGKMSEGEERRRGRKNTPPLTRHCTNPLPVKHLVTIQDGGIESLIYLAFRSKITPALQVTNEEKWSLFNNYSPKWR